MITNNLERRVAKLEKEVKWTRRKVKKIAEHLEFADNLNPLSLPDLLERDKEILSALLPKSREGASTTELARELNYHLPKTSGRTIIYRRLRYIAKISQRKKGFPIIVKIGRKWAMNFDDFSFIDKKGQRW